MKDGLTIGGLAKRSQVSRDTLRFYERKRLLPVPRRTTSGYRPYEDLGAARVSFRATSQSRALREGRHSARLLPRGDRPGRERRQAEGKAMRTHYADLGVVDRKPRRPADHGLPALLGVPVLRRIRMKRTLSLLIAAVASVSIAWSAETAKTTLKIEGMTCGGCVPAVNVQLKKTDGVVAYDVSFERGEAVVSYDPSKTTPAKIAESVTKTGYMASVRTQAAAANGSSNVAAAEAKADPATNAEPPERVTLFQVPLMCPAVKGLGCGGRARPFMAELEKQAEVGEAWLNHPGTVLAVVWKEPQGRAQAASTVGSLFEAKGLSVTPLQGPALNGA